MPSDGNNNDTSKRKPAQPFTDDELRAWLETIIKDSEGYLHWDAHAGAGTEYDRFEARIHALGFKTRPTPAGEPGCWISERKPAGNGRHYVGLDRAIAYRRMIATLHGRPYVGGEVHHQCHDGLCSRPGSHHCTGPFDPDDHRKLHGIEDSSEVLWERKERK